MVGRGQSLESNALVSSVTRRDVLIIGAGAAASSAIGVSANAQQADAERHGISAFGDLKYPADFKNFDYVNVNAPKGGTFSQIGPSRQFNQSFLTFNTLNSYILRGDAAQGMEPVSYTHLTLPTILRV